MFPILLLSIALAPVALGLLLARTRRRRGRLTLLLGILVAYYAMYIVMLYILRGRWVG